MAEIREKKAQRRQLRIRHRGRLEQIGIYFGKMLRMFVYQNDWKVLPMAALSAALVSMVSRKNFFITMEGNLIGSFALVCVAIWNGCFNSIQVICRERQIVKREHRSGMHISSYIASHMIYQALLCLAQTVLTLYVCGAMGVKYPEKGLITPWLTVDLGITIFLISYASDMLSLWVSAIAHTTTAAMTVMPFVLIFQLVFSGGIFSLPAWADNLSQFTISNYGLRCVAAQSDYNNTPMVSVWNTLEKVKDREIGGTVTAGQISDLLMSDKLKAVSEFRAKEIDLDALLRSLMKNAGLTPPETAEAAGEGEDAPRKTVTVGEILELALNNQSFEAVRDEKITVKTTVGELLEAAGEEDVKKYIQDMTSRVSANPDYENSPENVIGLWLIIGFFALAYALFAMITLEFIDKDKR